MVTASKISANIKVQIFTYKSSCFVESLSVDEQTPVICIAPIKIKEEFNQGNVHKEVLYLLKQKVETQTSLPIILKVKVSV